MGRLPVIDCLTRGENGLLIPPDVLKSILLKNLRTKSIKIRLSARFLKKTKKNKTSNGTVTLRLQLLRVTTRLKFF